MFWKLGTMITESGYTALAEEHDTKVDYLVSDDCRNVCINVSVRWDGVMHISPTEGIASITVCDLDGINRFSNLLKVLYEDEVNRGKVV